MNVIALMAGDSNDFKEKGYTYPKYFLELDNKPLVQNIVCLLYTSPSPRDGLLSRMPSSA